MEVIHTDLLTIGGGLAGLCAAIAARERGREVILCSRVMSGLASSSAFSQGSFRGQVAGFSAEQHRQLTLETGHQLNEPAMVEALAEDATVAVTSLRAYGIEIRDREKGFFVPARKAGQEGLNLTRPLAEHARRAGVRFLQPFTAGGLLQYGGRAAGAWGFVKKENQPQAIAARAVILATGGGGAAFLHTDNSPGSAGDGYALAYCAGLPLIDMEFVQFYPLTTARPGRPGRFVPAILGF